MLEKERQAKRNADRIVEEARYRVSMKRKLRQLNIPSSLIRNTSTENLEMLCNKLNSL
jgi:hypothetical protein